MMRVKVLGAGCARCKNTVALVQAVAREKGVAGVVINDAVVHAGGVPSREKVEGWLVGAAAS